MTATLSLSPAAVLGRTFEFDCTFVRATPEAVLVETGTGQVWLPNAQCTVERGMFGAARIHMPPWLAREKGLSTTSDDRQAVLL